MIGGGATAAASVTIARSRTTIVPAAEVAEPACLRLKEHDDDADQDDRDVDDADDVAHGDCSEVGRGPVEPDDPQAHGTLARGLATGHRLGDEEVSEVDEAGEEPGAEHRRIPRPPLLVTNSLATVRRTAGSRSA